MLTFLMLSVVREIGDFRTKKQTFVFDELGKLLNTIRPLDELMPKHSRSRLGSSSQSKIVFYR